MFMPKKFDVQKRLNHVIRPSWGLTPLDPFVVCPMEHKRISWALDHPQVCIKRFDLEIGRIWLKLISSSTSVRMSLPAFLMAVQHGCVPLSGTVEK